MPKNKHKYRFNIISALIIIIIAASVICVFLFIGEKAKNDVTSVVKNQHVEIDQKLIYQIKQSIEQEIKNTEKILITMAQIPEIRDGDTEICSTKLKKLFPALQVKWGNIGRSNNQGQFYCGVVDSIVGVDGTQYQYIRNIINDPDHHPVLGRGVPFEYKDGTKRFLVALHVPVYNLAGEFSGTLGTALYLSELEEKYLNALKEEQGSHAVLLDDNGDILYHPDPDLLGENVLTEKMQDLVAELPKLKQIWNKQLHGVVGSDEYYFRGQDKAASFDKIEISDSHHWSIAITTPLEQINSHMSSFITSTQQQLIVIVITVSLLVIIGLYVLLSWNRKLHNRVAKKTQDYLEQTQKVEQSDEKLKKTIKELEKLNKTMVGREMHMIDMKKEIEKLSKNKK
jgi:hypothetical protein